MKRITRELIEKHLGKQKRIKRLWSGGWFVDLESGASVTIRRKRIDFGKYREIENRSNVEEGLFQWEVQASLDLGQDVWGGIGLYGGGKPEDRAAILEYAASVGIDTGDQGLTLRHFGPEATIKYYRYGWRVSLPNGSSAKVTGSAVEEVTGGGDMFRSALRLIHEIAPDNVVVRGKPGFVLMGLNHGQALNIDVIPESDLGMFCGIAGFVAQLSGIAIACCWFDLWIAVLIGSIAGLLLCMAGARAFWRQMRALARKQGRKMVGLDTVDSATRKASIAEAKAKGML